MKGSSSNAYAYCSPCLQPGSTQKRDASGSEILLTSCCGVLSSRCLGSSGFGLLRRDTSTAAGRPAPPSFDVRPAPRSMPGTRGGAVSCTEPSSRTRSTRSLSARSPCSQDRWPTATGGDSANRENSRACSASVRHRQGRRLFKRARRQRRRLREPGRAHGRPRSRRQPSSHHHHACGGSGQSGGLADLLSQRTSPRQAAERGPCRDRPNPDHQLADETARSRMYGPGLVAEQAARHRERLG